MMPLLNLEDDMYTDLAASISAMMVRSYAVAIVKPAEARPTREERTGSLCDQRAAVHGALSGRSVPDRQAATVTVAPTGEVILVCAENHDTLLANIEKALAA